MSFDYFVWSLHVADIPLWVQQLICELTLAGMCMVCSYCSFTHCTFPQRRPFWGCSALWLQCRHCLHPFGCLISCWNFNGEKDKSPITQPVSKWACQYQMGCIEPNKERHNNKNRSIIKQERHPLLLKSILHGWHSQDFNLPNRLKFPSANAHQL